MHVKSSFSVIIFILILFSFFIVYFFNFNSQKLSPKVLDLDNISLYNKDIVYIKDKEWSLSIPKINLYDIPIKDSVEDDVLESYIGHFPTSSYYDGNVCLAAHNFGFSNNHFKNLYLLNYDDEIKYNYYGNVKIYKVKNKIVINDNELNVLNNTTNNKITLITCISGSPSKRLCIEAYCKE